MKNIILIGFMGAGKTTVGTLLAKEKGMKFVDTDERIVKEQGIRIPDLFARQGATKETILSRVQRDGSRPMLEGEDLEARVERLMKEREALYRKAAHLEVWTDKRSVYQVMQVVDQETRRFG